MWVVILFTLFLTYTVYYYCFKPYNYWKNRGIIYEIPLPIVGNFGNTIFKRKHASEIYNCLYNKYSSERYVGIYIFTKPALLLRDLGLIKKICEEELDHFSDRVKNFNEDFRGDISNNLGNNWDQAKTILKPAFSSQIENVFETISECAEIFSSYFLREDAGMVEVQLNDVFSRYECDVLSRVCFGVVSNSLEERDNDYFEAYKEMRSFGGFEKLKVSIMQLCPLLCKMLRIKVFPASKTDFYKKLMTEALHSSQSSEGEKQKNFLSYIKNVTKQTSLEQEKTKEERIDDESVDYEFEDAKCAKNQNKLWKEDELAAHLLMFLNSHIGIEAVLSASSFLAYELALNPSVQVKLQEEIDNVKNSDNKLTYDVILKMKYLDCVVSESLRKWPPIYQTDRKCTKNFFEVELSIPDDEKIVIEKNIAVIIPIMAIQRDPNYFPGPEKFSPERFNEENISKIVPGSYIPFGRGSHSCIGTKLALLEIKLLFFHLLYKFDLVPTENTKIRMEVSPQFDVNGGVNNFLGLKPRKVTSL